MQITINFPDNLSSEEVEQLIQEIKQRLLKEAASATPKKQCSIGLAKDQFNIPPAFFEPLPDDLINAFDGRSEIIGYFKKKWFYWLFTE